MNCDELSTLYHQSFFDLISRSRAVHLQHWPGEEVQRCSLLSIKTGGCSEDCAYCAPLRDLGLRLGSTAMTNDE